MKVGEYTPIVARDPLQALLHGERAGGGAP